MSNLQLNIDTNIKEELEKVKQLVQELNNLKETALMLQFISINEFVDATGWNKTTVQNLYNRPDFPSCNFGKEKKAELHAVIKYFEVPRRK